MIVVVIVTVDIQGAKENEGRREGAATDDVEDGRKIDGCEELPLMFTLGMDEIRGIDELDISG